MGRVISSCAWLTAISHSEKAIVIIQRMKEQSESLYAWTEGVRRRRYWNLSSESNQERTVAECQTKSQWGQKNKSWGRTVVKIENAMVGQELRCTRPGIWDKAQGHCRTAVDCSDDHTTSPWQLHCASHVIFLMEGSVIWTEQAEAGKSGIGTKYPHSGVQEQRWVLFWSALFASVNPLCSYINLKGEYCMVCWDILIP